MTMRSQIALLMAALVLSAGSAVAQGPRGAAPQASAGGVNVALIDISHVFKNHDRFKQRTEEIKNEIKDFETQINNERKQLNEKRQKLSDYQSGSREYQTLETEIAQQIANQNVTAELKRKEILEREAKVYFETYEEIRQAVEAFAKHHHIGLVLRFDSEEIDANDRGSVLRGVNRAVVYQDQINITYEILQLVNQPRTAAQPPAAAQPRTSQARPGARPAAPTRGAAAPRGTLQR